MITPEQVLKKKYRYWKWVKSPRYFLERLFLGKHYHYAERSLPRQMKHLRGHLALDTFEVVRVLGWTNQYEEDIYWVVLTRRPGEGVAISLTSACGGYIPLRKKIDAYDYWQTLHLWDLNGATVEHGLELCKAHSITVL